MALVIDELITELALDPGKHTAGTKEVLDNEKKVREASARTSKELQAQNKRSNESFTSLTRSAAGFAAVLIGGNGIKNFIENMLTGAAATGRLATNLGTSARGLSAWQYALQSVGGSAADANAAFQTMATAISNFRLTRQTGNDDVFRALGVRPQDLTNPEDMLLRIAETAQTMNRQTFVNLAERLGLSASTITLLAKGRQGIQGLVDEGERLYPLTEAQTAAALRYEAAMAKLSRLIEGKAAPWIGKLADGIASLIENKDAMAIFGDVATGAIVAIGLAAAAAYGPVFLLAASIAGVLRLRQLLKDASPEQRKEWERDAHAGYKEFLGKLTEGDLSGALDVLKRQATKGMDIMTGRNTGAGGGAPVRVPPGRPAVALNGNNPGGINDGSFARSQPGYVGPNGRYAAFATMQDGLNAQKALLRSYVARGYDTPTKIAQRWAPAGDGKNDPGAYAKSIADKMGIGVNDRIGAGQIDRFAQAQARTENARFGQMPNTPTDPGTALRSRLNAAGVKNETNLNGDIIIHTAATDAKGIARDIGPELKKRGVINQANVGLQ